MGDPPGGPAPLKPEAYVGFDSVQHLGGLLARYGARRVLLVTGGESYSLSGAEEALRSQLQLREVHRFFEFSENPKLDDVRAGIELYRRVKPDLLVAGFEQELRELEGAAGPARATAG